MKVTKEKLIAINNNLYDVSDIKGVKFAYAVSKNKRLFETEMTALSDMQKPSEGFVEYEKTLQELAKKHARTDEKGEIEMQTAPNGAVGFVIDEDNLIFNEAKKKLDKKFKKAIDERQEVSLKIDEVMKEEIDLSALGVHKILFKDLPDELNAKEFELLEFMIQE